MNQIISEGKAKKLKNWVKQQELNQLIQEKEHKRGMERHQREHEHIVSILAPQIKKVCQEFASIIGGKFEELEDVSGSLPCKFMIYKPDYGSVDVSIIYLFKNSLDPDPDIYVEVEAVKCTDSLFAKCEERGFLSLLSRGQRGYGIGYRISEGYGETDKYYTAAYKIPYHSFTVEELSTVLEEFCKDIMSQKATVRSTDSYSL